jgi:hypothetical protein
LILEFQFLCKCFSPCQTSSFFSKLVSFHEREGIPPVGGEINFPVITGKMVTATWQGNSCMFPRQGSQLLSVSPIYITGGVYSSSVCNERTNPGAQVCPLKKKRRLDRAVHFTSHGIYPHCGKLRSDAYHPTPQKKDYSHSFGGHDFMAG